jgi:hypothetical protein
MSTDWLHLVVSIVEPALTICFTRNATVVVAIVENVMLQRTTRTVTFTSAVWSRKG